MDNSPTYKTNALMTWIESEEGYFHFVIQDDHTLIVGFPQKKPELWKTCGALVTKREHVGAEPEIVALEESDDGNGFNVKHTYDPERVTFTMRDWVNQALTISLIRIAHEWPEWATFLGSLYAAIIDDAFDASVEKFIMVFPGQDAEA